MQISMIPVVFIGDELKFKGPGLHQNDKSKV